MSLLKLSIRSALALAAAATVAQNASALDISAYNSSTVNVYLSGSTAVDGTILNTALATVAPGGLCAAGTTDVYYIGTITGYSNRMIFCSASGTAGITSGTNLAIFKESSTGSVNGVTPLYTAAQGQPSGVSFINPAAITDAACATVGTVSATATLGAYTNHSNCPATSVTANVIPSAGFADVEAAILRTPANGTVNTSAVATYLTSKGTLDQVWTVLLTKNAFYALQAAEGFASPSDAPANAPSLSKQDIAGLLSGNTFVWSQLGLAPADNNVYICRRDNGSGTEASFEAYFLGARCSLSSLSLPPENGTTVFAAGSGGGVRACMQAFFSGGTIKEFYLGGSVTEPGNQYAIGINNAEITAGNLSGANDSFRAIAVDGVGPTVANVQNGFYPYFSTGVAYTISKGTGVLSGNPLLVVNSLLGKLGHPAFTAASNAGYTGVKPWSPSLTMGDTSPAGLYAFSNPPAVPSTSATAAANPTNAYTKNTSGVTDNCDTPIWDSNDLATTPVETKLLGSGVVNN